MYKTSVYLTRDTSDFNLRAFTGAVPKASMWNTITNVLRSMDVAIECYYCSYDVNGDEGYYTTSDGYYYATKQ